MSKKVKKAKTGLKGKVKKAARAKTRTKSASKAKLGAKMNKKTKAGPKKSTKLGSRLTSKTKTRTNKSKSKSKSKTKSKAKISFMPKGYEAVTPYLIIKNASKAIQFYKDIFGAKQLMRMDSPQGKILHAEIAIGGSKIMLSDDMPEMNAKSPESFGGSPVGIHLYLKDVDTILRNAVQAGAKLERPATDMFYGDRIGSITDPFGHKWSIATHIEDVTPKEMKKRMANFAQEKSQSQSSDQYQSQSTRPQQQAIG